MSRPVLRIACGLALAFGWLITQERTEAAELLILSGSDGEFVRECSHKDVVISGSKSKFVLTGGCQSLSVPGDGNQILADMAAGSEIYLRGSNNDIAWTKSRGEADPTIAADGGSNNIVQLGGESAKTDGVPASIAAENNTPTPANNAVTSVPSVGALPGGIVAVGDAAMNIKEPDKPRDNQAQSKKKRLSKSETGTEPAGDINSEVMLDLHSAVSLTIRHCHRHRRNNPTLCRYLE
jgi:hypothetical protein